MRVLVGYAHLNSGAVTARFFTTNNLLVPADGTNGHDYGAPGAFDGRSHDHSAQAWLSRHAGVSSAVLGGAAVAGGVLAGWLAQRR